MELIRIFEKEGIQVVSARELHDYLGLDKSHWKRWYEKNIVNNDFAIENEDYKGFAIMVNGNSSMDFEITLDFAKRISMLSRTEKGETLRKHFIECEKKLQVLKEAVLSNQLFKIPTTLSGALFLAAEQAVIIEEQTKLIEESKDKVDFYNTVAEAPDCFDFMEAAGILKIPHGKSIAGRNQLFEMLRKLKYIQPNSTLPYKSKVNEGIFKLIEVVENSRVFTKTVITQKGIIHLQKVLKHV